MNFSHAPRSSQPFDMSSATASVFGACRAASAARVEFYSFTLRSERLFGQAPSVDQSLLRIKDGPCLAEIEQRWHRTGPQHDSEQMQLAKGVLVKIEGVEKAVFDVRTVSWQGLLHSLGGGALGLHMATVVLRSLPQIRLGRVEALLQRLDHPRRGLWSKGCGGECGRALMCKSQDLI